MHPAEHYQLAESELSEFKKDPSKTYLGLIAHAHALLASAGSTAGIDGVTSRWGQDTDRWRPILRGDDPIRRPTSVQRYEIGQAGCGCPITEEQTANGASVPGTERTEHRSGCWDLLPGTPGYPESRHA